MDQAIEHRDPAKILDLANIRFQLMYRSHFSLTPSLYMKGPPQKMLTD
jgi:hypothetical protein